MSIKELIKSKPRSLRYAIIGALLGTMPSIALLVMGICAAIFNPEDAKLALTWAFAFFFVYLFYLVPLLSFVGFLIGIGVDKIKNKK